MANQGYNQFFKQRKQIARKKDGRDVPQAITKNGLRMKPRKKKMKPMPLRPIISCAVLLLMALTAAVNEDKVAFLLENVELQIFSKSFAQNETNAPAMAEKKAPVKSSLDKFEDEKKASKAGKKTWTQEEVKLFSTLEDRKKALDHREEELNQLQVELEKQRDELQAKLKRLEDLRKNISTKLEEQVDQDEEKVKKLVDVYSNMKPTQAAKIMEKLDEGLAIKILARMKKKSAAAILNLLEPEKGRRLSEKYVGYISMN